MESASFAGAVDGSRITGTVTYGESFESAGTVIIQVEVGGQRLSGRYAGPDGNSSVMFSALKQ